MIYLNVNQASQTFVVTLKERWKDFETEPESYLLELVNTTSKETFLLIPVVVTDNDRYTELRVGTNTDAATSGSISIQEGGEFAYNIYGQTGTTNLDPDNAAVIGTFEIGTCYLVAADYVDYIDQTAIPTSFIDA